LRLIDTNVIVYSVGRTHPLRDGSRRILTQVADGGLEATLDVESLQEILHLYSERRERRKGFDTLDDLLILFPNPIPIGRTEVETARELMRLHSFLGARDSIHAAVAINHDMEGIVSADKVFDRVRGVRRFDVR